MTNEEKARELSKKFARQYHANNWPEWSDDDAFHFSNEEIYNACIKMSAWKEQQMIEWLKENLYHYIGFEFVLDTEIEDATNLIIKDFKQEMEG